MYCTKCGKQIDDNANVCPYCGAATAARAVSVAKRESEFTGGVLMSWAVNFTVGLVTLLTLGLAFPAMLCWEERWKAEHTYINGRQLKFDGKGMQLFGKFLLWVLLTVVTIGIYAFFLAVKMKAWTTKHTHFVDNGEAVDDYNKSNFDGKWYQYLGVVCLTGFVSLITLGFGSYWAHCYTERWYCRHTYIDGERLCFTGKAGQYFGKRIVWTLLTIITFGIYSFWLQVNMLKWTVSHTVIDDNVEAV